MNLKWIEGGVCAPDGFRAAGIASGIKKAGALDMAMILSDVPCNTAAVFTTNKVKAAPVLYNIAALKENSKAQGIICNSGNANACTPNGLEVARETAKIAGEYSGLDARFLTASTGVIGTPLDIVYFRTGIPKLALLLSKDGNGAAANAIMTTDTVQKQFAVEFEIDGKKCHIGAMAKGSGMIHINMATMLAFFTTDIAIDETLLNRAFKEIIIKTFNQVSIDGDTSTNDTAIILANGMSQNTQIVNKDESYDTFYVALNAVAIKIAKALAKDGEGATKLIECRAKGFPNEKTALSVAKTVVKSSLVKSAIFGEDANWGRIICAIGYTPEEFNTDKIDIRLKSEYGEAEVCRNSSAVNFDESKAAKILSSDEIIIEINANCGSAFGSAWGCDLTYDYVKINGEYRS